MCLSICCVVCCEVGPNECQSKECERDKYIDFGMKWPEQCDYGRE